MMSKIERVKIATDYATQKVELANYKKKQNLWSEIDRFFVLYDVILNEGTTDFVGSFKKQFDKKHGSMFPSFMPIASKLDLSNVDMVLLQNLENEHNGIIDVDVESKDYGIYASTERQLKALNVANKILDVIASYEDFTGAKIPTMKYNEVSQMFMNLTRNGDRIINVEKISNL